MSRSRKGHSSSPSGGNLQNLASELDALRVATRQAHEAIQELKEERKGLQQDKRDLDLSRTLLEAAVKEAKDMIDHGIAEVMAAAIQGTISSARAMLNESVEEMKTTVEEFRKAKNQILDRATDDIAKEVEKVQTVSGLIEKRMHGRLEVVVAGDEDPIFPSTSTFGNGK